MSEKRYIISDAAKLVDVEAHVLRYWEEELGIDIPRNEMGHRYYTDFHIGLLKNIKELKDYGYQLKAIKMLLGDLIEIQKNGGENLDEQKKELFGKVAVYEKLMEEEMIVHKNEEKHNGENSLSEKSKEENSLSEKIREEDKLIVKKDPPSGEKVEKFKEMLTEIMNQVISDNTKQLGRRVGDIVSDNVMKEMDYLMHIQEKQEEERFQKLDASIRELQRERKKEAQKSRNIFGRLRPKW